MLLLFSLSYGEPIRIQAQEKRSPPHSQVQYINKEPEPVVLPAQLIDEQDMYPMEGERYIFILMLDTVISIFQVAASFFLCIFLIILW